MKRTVGIADTAGVTGAILAALCCAGAPMILSVLAVLGLSFLRTDRILLPFIGLSLAVALWGFWQGRRIHRIDGPLLLAVSASVALIAGIVFVHGVPARVLIGTGAIALVVATVWNVGLRLRHAA
jgi:mercuric ion transport protein